MNLVNMAFDFSKGQTTQPTTKGGFDFSQGQPVSNNPATNYHYSNPQGNGGFVFAPADQQQKPQSILKQFSQILPNIKTGIEKGALSTVRGMATLGEKGLNYIDKAVGSESAMHKVTGTQPGQTSAEALIPESATKAEGFAQSLGKGAEQLGEFLIPGGAAGEAGKAVEMADFISQSPKLAKLLGFGAKLTTEGLVGAGQQAMQQGSTDNFLGNAMLFGGMSGVGELAGKAGKFATKELPGRLVNSALKPSVQELEKATKYGGDTLGKQVAEKGLVGTDKGLYKQSMKAINENENKLQEILKESPGTISKGDFYKYISPQIEKLSKTPGMENDFNHVVEVFSQLPKDMSLAEANVVKRNLYNALNDKAFFLDPNLSAKKETMKAIAKGIKTEIENKTANTAGEGVVKQINQELALHGKVADRTLKNIAKEEKKNIVPALMSRAGYALGGGALGYHKDGLPGAVFGAGLGLAGEHLMDSTLGKTLEAKALTTAGKLPLEEVGKIIKPTVIKAIRKK